MLLDSEWVSSEYHSSYEPSLRTRSEGGFSFLRLTLDSKRIENKLDQAIKEWQGLKYCFGPNGNFESLLRSVWMVVYFWASLCGIICQKNSTRTRLQCSCTIRSINPLLSGAYAGEGLIAIPLEVKLLKKRFYTMLSSLLEPYSAYNVASNREKFL